MAMPSATPFEIVMGPWGWCTIRGVELAARAKGSPPGIVPLAVSDEEQPMQGFASDGGPPTSGRDESMWICRMLLMSGISICRCAVADCKDAWATDGGAA